MTIRQIRIQRRVREEELERREKEWRDIMSHQRYLQTEQTRIEAILCNIRLKIEKLARQEVYVLDLLDDVSQSSATSEPNNEMEG